jgi:pimeloyl-ACP methyl ester carboxylesterase
LRTLRIRNAAALRPGQHRLPEPALRRDIRPAKIFASAMERQMRNNRWCRSALIAALLLAPQCAAAQSNPQFIAFPGISKAVLYKPDAGPAPHVGILVMHPTSNYLRHRACTELSRRGFMMLCMNTRFENNEALVDFEKLPLDVKAGVDFLRQQPDITKVVLFAHSGGGPLMALYQAIAENGPGYCKGPNKLVECGDDLAGMVPADGIIFADAHPGNSINTLRGLNPAVANENNPPDAPLVADLDPFDPKNGFNPNGPSHYSAEFQARYFKAQADRMNALIEGARDKLARMKRNDYPYPDDDILLIPRGGNPGAGPGAAAALFGIHEQTSSSVTASFMESVVRKPASLR